MQVTDEEFESMYKVRKIIDNFVNLLSEIKELNEEEYKLLISTLEYSLKKEKTRNEK